ncbi:endo alpha-1,4 polygalactosaminidase [Catenulispora sp. GAS73]|uniref:endo alpha-1,4 polygalactosaminidase n=1 Tax=Catenulispora sp. GAS73 TaxID=3156269 RepID=UPI003515CF61
MIGLVLTAGGCSQSSVEEPSPPPASMPASTVGSAGSGPGGKTVALPQPGAKWDYQIGGAYPPPDGVRIVSRDSTAAPAAGLYNICYINAYQTQPGDEAINWWKTNHPDLLLKAGGGDLVIDKDWGEPLLDVSTPDKRARLTQIEAGWIDGCASKGFQAIEPDNVDSYGRSNGLLTAEDNVEFAKLLVAHAHADGLAIAQKNAAELSDRRKQVGFDFAVVEQCGSTDECAQYATAFDLHVVDVEYDDTGFGAACKSWGTKLSVVRRDHGVSPKSGSGYVYRTC